MFHPASKGLLLCSVLYYIWLCPYTKVEESFNMQAVHDLLTLNNIPLWDIPQNYVPPNNIPMAVGTLEWQSLFRISEFDHLEFPGVVPRTFLGSIFLAACSAPISTIFQVLDLPSFYSQYLIRSVLGVTSSLAFSIFSDAISIRFGSRAGGLTCVLAALQFHLPFYMSRTLPNTFALIFCLVGYSYWLRGRGLSALLVIATAMVVFRCDLLLLLAPLTLQMLLSREVPFWWTAFLGVGVSAIALVVSVGVDSYFWNRLTWPEGEVLFFNTVDSTITYLSLFSSPSLFPSFRLTWPEGEVLFFNTVENKSSEWGVMAWHWYLSNALPKSLHISILLAVCGVCGLRYPLRSTGASCIIILGVWSSLVVLDSAAVVDDHSKSPGNKENKENADLGVLSVCRLTLLGLLGPLDPSLLYYCCPVPCYIALYSILPHKELRFIFPVLPLITMAAAVGLDRILPTHPTILPHSVTVARTGTEAPVGVNVKEIKGGNKGASTARTVRTVKRAAEMLLWTGFTLLLLLSVLLSVLFAAASRVNYPGGEALSLMGGHIQSDYMARIEREYMTCSATGSSVDEGTGRNEGSLSGVGGVCGSNSGVRGVGGGGVVRVHIDVAAAMTGVTRFGQQSSIKVSPMGSVPPSLPSSTVPPPSLHVAYYKEEGLGSFDGYDWLLTEDPRSHGKGELFYVVAEVSSFSSFSLLSPLPFPFSLLSKIRRGNSDSDSNTNTDSDSDSDSDRLVVIDRQVATEIEIGSEVEVEIEVDTHMNDSPIDASPPPSSTDTLPLNGSAPHPCTPLTLFGVLSLPVCVGTETAIYILRRMN